MTTGQVCAAVTATWSQTCLQALAAGELGLLELCERCTELVILALRLRLAQRTSSPVRWCASWRQFASSWSPVRQRQFASPPATGVASNWRAAHPAAPASASSWRQPGPGATRQGVRADRRQRGWRPAHWEGSASQETGDLPLPGAPAAGGLRRPRQPASRCWRRRHRGDHQCLT